MTKKQERHIIASVGTVLFMLLLFLILWFMRLYSVKEAEQEGIEVAFGEVAEAGGYMAEQSEAVPLPAPQPVAPAPQPKQEDPVLTAEEEQALAMQQAQKKKEQEEKARLEAERRQREKEAAEKKAKEDAERKKAQDLINGKFFGSGGDATGSGDSKGAGQKGNPVGHGSVGGNDWSLNGRDIKSLPAPSKDFKQEGKVVVQIKVDAAGNVIDARETAGNTISDKQTIQLALEAAKKAKFTEGDHDQIGTITYIFKLN